MPRQDDDEFVINEVRKENLSSGRSKYLALPAGLPLFPVKQARTVYAEFIPFLVTDSHLRYDRERQFAAPKSWYPKRTFDIHRNIGPDNEAHLCAWTTLRRPCPVCEVRQKFAQKGTKEASDKAYDLKPSVRQLYLLSERDERDWELGNLQLWDESYHSFGKQLAAWIAGTPTVDREAYERYWHPRHGFTVAVMGTKEKTGDGGGEYTKWAVREFRPRREPLPREIFDHGYNLDDIIQETPYDDFKRLFLGLDEDAAAADVGRTSVHTDAQPPTGGPPPKRWGNAPAAPTAAQQNGTTAHQSTPRSAPPPADDAPPPARRAPAPPPPPADAPQFASRDTISFKYDGDEYRGTVVKVNHDKRTLVVQVDAEGWDKPVTLDFEEATLVAADDTFDAKLPPPAEEAPPPPPARRAPAPAAAPTPAAAAGSRKPRTWEDADDDAPLERAPAAAPPPDEAPPPPPKRARR